MKVRFKKYLWLIAALGWWGMLYPDLCLMEDTVTIVYEASQDERTALKEMPSGSDLYYRILSARPEQIKVKSKLLETISDYFEKGKEK